MLVCAGGLLLVLILFYGVWRPAQEKLSQAHSRYDLATTQYQTLLVNAERLASSPAEQQKLADRGLEQLHQLISRTTNKVKLGEDGISVEGDSRIQIWASDVPFATVAAWLDELARQRVAIYSFQLERVAEGRVNLRFTLD